LTGSPPARYSFCKKRFAKGTFPYNSFVRKRQTEFTENSLHYHQEDHGHDSCITKYILPAKERVIALHNLKTYNINSFSLFANEESLLETLFLERYIIAGSYKNGGMDDINMIWI
jgi:hypothetical protein